MAQTKQQREIVVLVVLVLVAVLVWRFYWGKGRTEAGVLSESGNYVPINAEDYGHVFRDLGDAQGTVYKPTGRNIFIAGPTPVASGASGSVQPAPKPTRPPVGPFPQPEPPPPVLPWKLFGLGALPTAGTRQAFLLDGEEVHIVAEGDTIQNHIRITHIGNDRIEYEDVNTGKKNSTVLEMPSAPS